MSGDLAARRRLAAMAAGGVGADARDHRGKAVGALRRQMLLETRARRRWDRGRWRGSRRHASAVVDGEQDRDEPAHDVRVAVGVERERGRAAAGLDAASRARPGWRSRAPCWRRCAARRAAAAACGRARSRSGSGPPSRRGRQNRRGSPRASGKRIVSPERAGHTLTHRSPGECRRQCARAGVGGAGPCCAGGGGAGVLACKSRGAQMPRARGRRARPARRSSGAACRADVSPTAAPSRLRSCRLEYFIASS